MGSDNQASVDDPSAAHPSSLHSVLVLPPTPTSTKMTKPVLDPSPIVAATPPISEGSHIVSVLVAGLSNVSFAPTPIASGSATGINTKTSPTASPRIEPISRPSSPAPILTTAPASLPNQVHRKGLRPYVGNARWAPVTDISPLALGVPLVNPTRALPSHPQPVLYVTPKLSNEATAILFDPNPEASSRSLPAASVSSHSARPNLMKLFAPPLSYESDSEDDTDLSSASSQSSRRGQKKKRRDSTTPARTSISGIKMTESTSNLSLANIAASIQSYQRKRNALDNGSYMDVYGDREEFEQKRDFMTLLARSMVEYGVPIHRFEYHLEAVSTSLGVESTFIVLAGLILISFAQKGRAPETHLIRCTPGYQMGKLSLTNELCFELVHGGTPVHQAQTRLMKIRSLEDSAAWKTMLTYPIIAFFICIIGFNGRWLDATLAAVASTPVAILSYLGGRYPGVTYLVEFLSTLFVTVIGNSLLYAVQTPDSCLSIQKIVFSGVAILLPGLQLTTAIIEISTRNLISGTVRLFLALFIAMLLGFGFSIGLKLTSGFSTPEPGPDCILHPINVLWFILLFPPLAIAIGYQFQARKSQYIIMVFTPAVGFAFLHFLSQVPLLSDKIEIVTIISALSIGLISNIYARITRDVAIAPILAGILLLVPGAVGVRSTLGFISHDTLGGTEVAFQMLLIGLCITIGLFVATLTVWPIRGPRMKYITV
ncbi:hypothetical protein BASA50_001156 [Batrachochytrium salamandrivorans]|uniref:Threonine/serine exporter-like N-terminal domain-containing protein n=1 Tax=Batrachochytrium salamandrivorans TaxID=1357716 RepID=A0ABQ8ERS5_9FUNG|nr:hypothetical protein BASA60_008823 [Batrachochytrium salamandrivorans]KAH6578057.1 hypothetical protein BASA62_000496 [Batrachochytrium salamandrivorans]KAH6579137.1 hypothetical protein BASA61_010439 [Batrachochytrium salamandrivorans]KAH6585547.1 hypothetical protein BASA50_001156 [Batrachochytrium salamandrivorans]KAH9248372.1 hypothetical protein BASA81_013958 [Batrachochytrium salamandrivorans]